MLSKAISAAFGLAAVANAHMYLTTPMRLSSPSATNGPISASNFPCQSTAPAMGGPVSTMSLGSDQPLAFAGQSVHGGGSCQISITYDENPTKDSVWKVITSIVGGCVAEDTVGNLGTDESAEAADPYTYNFTIPEGIPTGKATLAWTWLNKVGNREFYMQCAAIELAGTSGSQSTYDALPDMFVANIDSTCTVEDGDYQYPDPGNVVYSLNGATTAWATTAGTCTIGVGSGSGSGSGSSSDATTTAEATATATAGIGGGVFATSGASAPAATPETTTSVVAPAASATGSTSSSGSGSSSSSSSSGSTQSGACTDEGDYACVDGSTYQVCASGQWSVAMSVASGTECSGTGSSFAIAAAASKRTPKYMRSREERRVNKRRGLPLLFGQN